MAGLVFGLIYFGLILIGRGLYILYMNHRNKRRFY